MIGGCKCAHKKKQSAVDACELGVEAVELDNQDQYYGLSFCFEKWRQVEPDTHYLYYCRCVCVCVLPTYAWPVLLSLCPHVHE